MVQVVDHQQTGKRKFIQGPGRKRDVPLEHFDNKKIGAYSSAQLDNAADQLLQKKEISVKLSVAKKSKNSHKPKWQKKKIKKMADSLRRFKQGVNYLDLSHNERVKIQEYLQAIDNILINKKTMINI